jgi:GAF domain-containing protein
MEPGDRERWLTRSLLELADGPGEGADLIELMTRLAERCVELIDAADVGILLSEDGVLKVLAATSERMELLELFEVQNQEGPCLDTCMQGIAIINGELDGTRWTAFAQRAREAGYDSVHAFPLRHHGETIGAMNVFHRGTRRLSSADAGVAQALADMATIAVMHHRAIDHAAVVSRQLESALRSRVVVEQAKGILAERLHIDLETAFELIRHRARDHNERVHDVAQGVIDGSVSADRLLDAARKRP